jgi:nitronate monooxygenase
VQVGTPFAFCDESGIDPQIRNRVIQETTHVLTAGHASPTGFPFKVVQLQGTLSDDDVYASRGRICDMGYLRQVYRGHDGKVGYRCGAEPVDDFVKKGGSAVDTIGRKCLCNGLLATAGMGQVRNGGREPAIVTAGDSLKELGQFLQDRRWTYSAADVIDRILVQQG